MREDPDADASDEPDAGEGATASDKATTSTDATANEAGGPSSLPACPVCGRPVTVVTTTGPDTGTVRPCGCSVPPCVIRLEGDDPEAETDSEPETDADSEPETGTEGAE